MVLDRGSEYKMVSIMRQRRPVITTDPFMKHSIINEEDESKLSQIEDEQSMRWTAALPKFGVNDYLPC